MTEEQRAELAGLRAEQRELRTRLDRLERRLESLTEPEPAPPPPPPRPAPRPRPVLLPPVSWPEAVPRPVAPPVLASPAAEPLEVRLGAKWIVRLAMFMLVAALAFLANYLYQNVIPHLGPAAKVGLLSLGAGALTGAGLWLERSRPGRENAGMLNYARVVLAGGLAAGYYVIYAAHHFERLRVIGSPLVAALLLLAWTALMTWMADRRSSSTLAAFSILLAYFSSATSDVVGFTLVANLALTLAAVFLVLRRRWTVFSFACLLATFGSYAFWRYGDWFGAGTGGAGWRTEGAFLGCYWALFTVAAFVDRQEAFAGPGRRATFVSLNNGAFFALVGLLLREQTPGLFWRWPLGFGVALLALGELGRRRPRPLDPASVDACSFGGIGLVTLGLILYFSGWRLGIILAVESAVVLAAAGRRGSRPLFVAAGGVALAGAVAALSHALGVDAREHGLAGAAVGAILLFNAWQCRHVRREGEAYHALLGLLTWFATLETQITHEIWRSPLLAVAALALTAAFYPLRLRAAAALAQFYLLAAYWHWTAAYGVADRSLLPPLWNPAVVLAVTVALGTAIERLKKWPLYEAAAFVLFVVVADKYFDPPGQFTLLATGGAAVLGFGWVIRGPRLRWWSLALNALALLVFAAARPASGYSDLPGLVLLAAAQPFVRRFAREPGGRRLEGALISVAALGVWIWVTRQLQQAGMVSFTIVAGWSIYGGVLFGIGIAVRERVCRWWGLGVLAAALGHIVLFDIWTLGNLERFVSLFVISLVLLAVGFFYNRLSSSLREWF